MLVQAAVLLVVLVGLAFGVQAAFLNVPSNAQLVAVDALKALARYHVMDGTEQLSTRPRRTLCFENRVLDRKTDSFVLGSFVLVGRRQRYYDLGHGVKFSGAGELTYKTARNRFLLAGCPEFLAQRLGTLLLQWRQIRVTNVRVRTVRFGRSITGCRYARAAESRRPRWMLRSNAANPSWR